MSKIQILFQSVPEEEFKQFGLYKENAIKQLRQIRVGEKVPKVYFWTNGVRLRKYLNERENTRIDLHHRDSHYVYLRYK